MNKKVDYNAYTNGSVLSLKVRNFVQNIRIFVLPT